MRISALPLLLVACKSDPNYAKLDSGATGDTEIVEGDTDTDADADTDTDTDTDTDADTDTDTDTDVTANMPDYVHLQHPCSTTVVETQASEPIYCWVFDAGVTAGMGQGAGVLVDVGVGPDGSDPATGAWTWSSAAYSADKDGLVAGDQSNDEYVGAFVAPSPGAWDYACRASADGGATWIYGDRGDDFLGGCGFGEAGSNDGYDPADAGQATVDVAPVEDTDLPVETGDTGVVPVPVDYCHMQFPCATTAAAGAASEPVYCWVYEGGATPGAGAGAGLTVEVGVGADGGDPAAFTWSSASYLGDKDGISPGDLSNDEYVGGFTAPGVAGAYDYACRASADGGSTWLYCDQGDDNVGGCGAGKLGSGDGYAPADAGQLTVP